MRPIILALGAVSILVIGEQAIANSNPITLEQVMELPEIRRHEIIRYTSDATAATLGFLGVGDPDCKITPLEVFSYLRRNDNSHWRDKPFSAVMALAIISFCGTEYSVDLARQAGTDALLWQMLEHTR